MRATRGIPEPGAVQCMCWPWGRVWTWGVKAFSHPVGPEILADMAYSFICVGSWTFQTGNGGEGIDGEARGSLVPDYLSWG